MTRQEKIEELQDKVWHNKISNIDDLRLEISCAEYDGEEVIEEIDDILAPLEFNYCDLCGGYGDEDECIWQAIDDGLIYYADQAYVVAHALQNGFIEWGKEPLWDEITEMLYSDVSEELEELKKDKEKEDD